MREACLALISVLGVFLLQVSSESTVSTVPVLLWGGSRHLEFGDRAVNPLLKTSPKDFVQILNRRMGDLLPAIVVFVRETLCVEDLVAHKEHLKEIKDSLTYLPAVTLPLKEIEKLPSYNQSTEDDVNTISDGQIVFKSVVDLDTVPEVYKTAHELNPDLIAVLTGRLCPYSSRPERIRRAAEDKPESTAFIISDRILLYNSEPPYVKTPDYETQLPSDPKAVRTRGSGTDKDPLILRMEFEMKEKTVHKLALEFEFVVKTAGYYTFTRVKYKENDTNNDTYLYTNADIVFPFNFSYHCSQNTVFSINNTIFLNMTNMQVQVDATSFSDAYDCVGFTTIPIWMGIFVTAILALIMIWALTMIIDIRTMDRFDDPKGKTITVSVQE